MAIEQGEAMVELSAPGAAEGKFSVTVPRPKPMATAHGRENGGYRWSRDEVAILREWLTDIETAVADLRASVRPSWKITSMFIVWDPVHSTEASIFADAEPVG